MKSILVSLCCFLTCFVYSQSGFPLNGGAKMIGMGNPVSLSEGTDGIFGNQAGMTTSESLSAQINSGNSFLSNGLNHFGFGVLVPLKSDHFGVSISQYGIKEFKEQKFGIAYARNLAKNLNVGIQFDYFQIQTDEFGNKGILSFEGGLQSQIHKNWKIGVHFLSPVQTEITSSHKLPTVFRLGTAFIPSEKVQFLVEAEKDILHPLRINSGIEYKLNNVFTMRLGIRTKPTNFNFGIGGKISEKIAFDLALSYHQILGFSPIFSVVYNSKTR